MPNGLRYESGRDMPPGMQELMADQIVQRIQKEALAAAVPEFTYHNCGGPANKTQQIGKETPRDSETQG